MRTAWCFIINFYMQNVLIYTTFTVYQTFVYLMSSSLGERKQSCQWVSSPKDTLWETHCQVKSGFTLMARYWLLVRSAVLNQLGKKFKMQQRQQKYLRRLRIRMLTMVCIHSTVNQSSSTCTLCINWHTTTTASANKDAKQLQEVLKRKWHHHRNHWRNRRNRVHAHGV